MLKKLAPVAISVLCSLAALLPAGAQGNSFDMHSLIAAGMTPRYGGTGYAVSRPAYAASSTDYAVSSAYSGNQGNYGGVQLNENRGNTTYKTGEGSKGSLYPQSSMQTRKQIPGTLTVVSTGGLAPVFGPTAGDIAASGGGTAGGGGANPGANPDNGATNTAAAGVASTSDGASVSMGGGAPVASADPVQSITDRVTVQPSSGSGF